MAHIVALPRMLGCMQLAAERGVQKRLGWLGQLAEMLGLVLCLALQHLEVPWMPGCLLVLTPKAGVLLLVGQACALLL